MKKNIIFITSLVLFGSGIFTSTLAQESPNEISNSHNEWIVEDIQFYSLMIILYAFVLLISIINKLDLISLISMNKEGDIDALKDEVSSTVLSQGKDGFFNEN